MLNSAILLASFLLAPSSNTLLFVRSGNPAVGTELMTSSPAGVRSLGLSQPESAGALLAAISPDQSRIAFLSGSRLYTAAITKSTVAIGAAAAGRPAPSARVMTCAARRQRDGSWTGAVLTAEGLTGPINWCGSSDLILMRSPRSFGAEGDIVRLTLRPDGSLMRERQLTNVGSDSHRDYSPSVTNDGRKLVFVRFVNGRGPQLITASTEGGSEVQLSPGTGIWRSPVWSHDGSKILAYQQSTATSPATPGGYLMNPDGTGATVISSIIPDDGNFVFGIGGTEVSFAREFHSRTIHQKDVYRTSVRSTGEARSVVVSPGMNELPLQWIALR